MKKFLCIIPFVICLIIQGNLFGQIPEAINHQMVVRDAGGAPIPTQSLLLKVSILSNALNGNVVYCESHNVTTNQFGLATVKLGIGTVISGVFADIEWYSGVYYLKQEIDMLDGNGFLEMGTTQLVSVPYSMHSGGLTLKSPNGTLYNVKVDDQGNINAEGLFAPVAGFTSDVNVGISPLIVAFVDTSLYSPNTWLWSFGDGHTSTEQNPNHTYELPGTYSVSLYVENNFGSDSDVKIDFVTVSPIGNGSPCPDAATVTDIDGNVYNTVQIGTQCWMKENLMVTHYPNGDPIPQVTDNSVWAALEDNNTDDAFCYYGNNINSEYGALYNFAAVIADNWERDNVDGQGICPDGWHAPSHDEWFGLEEYMIANGFNWDGTLTEDKIAKSLSSTYGWDNYHIQGTVGHNQQNNNSSGFNAMPGGQRTYYGSYEIEGRRGMWWTSSEKTNTFAWFSDIDHSAYNLDHFTYDKTRGFSVRCLKDAQQYPTADYTASPLSGEYPLQVSFTDLSTGTSSSTTYLWNFGDGNTSTIKNPVHIYSLTGVYSVSLSVSNGMRTDTKTKVEHINVTSSNGGGSPCPGTPTVTDIDGNVYNTVQIGSQCWMKEDLKVTHYPNGDTIPFIPGGGATWGDLLDNNTDDAYCYHIDTPNIDYGALYSFSAAIADNWERDNLDGQGICPDGWHLPDYDEWNVLHNHVGGTAGKLKEQGISHWNSPNMGATNETGFTALPGGYVNANGLFYPLGHAIDWWTATEYSDITVWGRYVTNAGLGFGCMNYYHKSSGFFVRCVKNE